MQSWESWQGREAKKKCDWLCPISVLDPAPFTYDTKLAPSPSAMRKFWLTKSCL